MSGEKQVTKEELSAVKYGKLLERFTELGVAEAWKPGSKKITMIENAIEKLKIKNSLESLGLDKEQVSEEIEKMAKKKVKAKEDEALKQAKLEEEKQKQVVKKAEQANFSKEDIEKNIKIIEANIKFGVPAHRVQLQTKLEILLDLLAKK